MILVIVQILLYGYNGTMLLEVQGSMKNNSFIEVFFAEHGDATLPTGKEELRRVELGAFVFQSNLGRSTAAMGSYASDGSHIWLQQPV